MSQTVELPRLSGPGSDVGGLWRGVVLNDDHNTFDHVAETLSRVIPGVSLAEGYRFADRIHKSGCAIVWSGPRDEAEQYWEQLNGAGLTCTTFQTTPSFSSSAISSPVGSATRSHGLRPWKADVGKAWWLWCQASPIDSGASQNTLRDSSSVSNRLRPKKWQTELIDHVTWCRRKTRTKPPHSKAVSAAPIPPPMSQPSVKGIAKPRTTQRKNSLSMTRITPSLSRSDAKRWRSAAPAVSKRQA